MVNQTPPIPTPPEPVPEEADSASGKPSLTQVLDQSEQIKGAVEECAAELSSVNSALNDELGSQPLEPALQAALAQSETIEAKVQDCADDLTAVNQALKVEVEERQILEHQLVAAQKQEAAARHAAFHDPLTSLPNRVLFNDRLEHGLAQAKRHGWILAVMFIDLDGFKNINDTYGHAAGDQLLQLIAHRLKSMTRDDDTVSRHGGDEFLFLLLELKTEADATMIAEKIIQVVGEPCTITVNDLELNLNIKLSIGIALYPNDGFDAETLVNSADRAMYQAKRTQVGFAFDRP